MLNHLKKIDDCYSNAYATYRILLTIPIIVASAQCNEKLLQVKVDQDLSLINYVVGKIK